MLSNFVFWIIILTIASFYLVPLIGFIIGFIQGITRARGNGFSDYVNSNRLSDRR